MLNPKPSQELFDSTCKYIARINDIILAFSAGIILVVLLAEDNSNQSLEKEIESIQGVDEDLGQNSYKDLIYQQRFRRSKFNYTNSKALFEKEFKGFIDIDSSSVDNYGESRKTLEGFKLFWNQNTTETFTITYHIPQLDSLVTNSIEDSAELGSIIPVYRQYSDLYSSRQSFVKDIVNNYTFTSLNDLPYDSAYFIPSNIESLVDTNTTNKYLYKEIDTGDVNIKCNVDSVKFISLIPLKQIHEEISVIDLSLKPSELSEMSRENLYFEVVFSNVDLYFYEKDSEKPVYSLAQLLQFNKRNTSNKHTIEFLGMSIPSKILRRYGVPVLILLQLYFLTHLYNFQKIRYEYEHLKINIPLLLLHNTTISKFFHTFRSIILPMLIVLYLTDIWDSISCKFSCKSDFEVSLTILLILIQIIVSSFVAKFSFSVSEYKRNEKDVSVRNLPF